MRRASLMAARASRITRLIEEGYIKSASDIPEDAVPAMIANQKNQLLCTPHVEGDFKTYYRDKPFTCKKCGTDQIWKAEDQQWYYEIVKGFVRNEASLCAACRKVKIQTNEN